ncbi:hypothetical protein F4560_004089 [Saccharothrix ecbatanensis]|uniref:Uncharacterized protein n=1 Tax=Saccharothrix ecbatanensis TaxID=1105145 RepID=A0A7W9HLQ1_9PSEU|nr:DUF6183 family protein [Saccharothrix ecbatanensis]MBB5804321.1 hypothetical protein [Saccharothrix ecbatanensis]
MTEEIQKIVAGLPDLADVKGVWAVADDRLARGDAAFVSDLGIALATAYGDNADRMWQYKSVFNYLLRSLTTTAGQQNVTQALRLVSSVGAGGNALGRYAASLLAAAQSPDDLAVAFAGQAAEELHACLVHELVLRGVVVTETRIAEWATSSYWQDHPLSWLPLTLSNVEGRPSMPGYSRHGGSHSLPFGPSEGRGAATVSTAGGPLARETTTQEAVAAVTAAVMNWTDESNGRIEARVFDFAEPLDAESTPKALPALELECLNGVGEKAAVSVSACAPSQVWALLYAAASTGGAYNSGVYGAYGRLAAWQSLAGLSGAPEGASFHEVEALVGNCAWHVFDADTEWFEHVAWDLGVAAVAPNGTRLAVLAATDTD